MLKHSAQIAIAIAVVVAWLSGSALVSFNLVTLRLARILGWLTVCGWVNLLGISSHVGQLSLSSFHGR